MNLGQFRTNLDRLTGVGMDADAQTAWINAALHEVASERDWPWLEGTDTFNTADGTAQYALPSDWQRSRGLLVAGEPAAYVNVAEGDDYADWDQMEARWSYTVDADQLTIYPTPGAVLACTHRYVKEEADLSSDSDTPLIPDRFHWMVVHLAAHYTLARMGDMPRSSFHRNQYDGLLSKAVRSTFKTQGPYLARIRPGGM